MDPNDLNLMIAARSGYLAQLAADALSLIGQPSYSLDGESLSRTEWRAATLKLITDITAIIATENPFEFWTQAI